MTLTLVDILRSSSAYLGRAGVDRPRLEAELLIGHVLHLERLQLYVQFERPLDEPELGVLRSILKRRAGGAPLAYLIGEREFFGLSFLVREGVLIPRPESELVVELGLARIAAQGGPVRAADLGTGSGCLGIALTARSSYLQMDAVDVSMVAVDVARENASRLGVRDRFTVLPGSWCDPLLDRGPYDLVVSNPPYVTTQELTLLEPVVRDFEPHLALEAGEDGLDSYRALLAELPRITAPGATVLLEVDPRRAQAVVEVATQIWAGPNSVIHRDLTGRDRVVEVTVP
ncbi:MAG: peptide chain release factor N(5)-glutamine methyltransferase [Candidatus Dormiibacterota bacterium]